MRLTTLLAWSVNLRVWWVFLPFDDLIVSHRVSVVKGFFTFFLLNGFRRFFEKIRGRERPHRDLNPFPHWLAEVVLSLPLTIIV